MQDNPLGKKHLNEFSPKDNSLAICSSVQVSKPKFISSKGDQLLLAQPIAPAVVENHRVGRTFLTQSD
jgi:hypothetical protein